MRTVLMLITAVGLLGSAACGGSGNASATPSASSSTPARAGEFILALGEINPGLIVNRDRALRRARDVCLDISQGRPAATVVRNARLRYNGGDATVSVQDAKRIVAAAKRYVC